MPARAIDRLSPLRADVLLPHRIATAVLVEISILSGVVEGALPAASGAIALVLVPIGFVVSWVRRGRPNIALKAGAAAGLLLAFAGFMSGVRGATGIDDTRVPLAALFVWVQVLHSFDVPRRRDLAFSVASSVALFALAGSLAFSTGFLLLFVAFAAAFVAALRTGYVAGLHERATSDAAPATAARRPPRAWTPIAVAIAGTLAASFVALVAMPRLPGIQVAALPFSIARATGIDGFNGQVVNPGRSSDGGSSGTAFPPNVYPGYGASLDLRARGRPDQGLAMRVRSPEPALYRAQAFDTYDGSRWVSAGGDLRTLTLGDGPAIHVPDRGPVQSREVVQTFYVERTLPNVVFHAAFARELHLPSSRVEMDDAASFRLPFLLEADTVYSVVSEVPDVTTEQLRMYGDAGGPHPPMDRYLTLPPTLPDRVRDLASRIIGGRTTTADRVQAVEGWLEENTRYRLDVPVPPAGMDQVDAFLFGSREGFCEQIASAMAVLLRASGVPTRIVTGFGPGQRNLLSGYWEVRNADAHAWLEVWYPGFGWMASDPTFGVPHADGASNTFLLEPVGRFIGDHVPTAFRNLGSLGSAPAAVARAALLVLAIGLTVAFVSRARRRPRSDDPASAAWLRVEAALAREGFVRRPSETATEFVRRVGPELGEGEEEVRRFTDAFVRARYGPTRGTGALDTLGCSAASAARRRRAPVFDTR
jgi:protein-glutamine gamma-glutamyltransferase